MWQVDVQANLQRHYSSTTTVGAFHLQQANYACPLALAVGAGCPSDGLPLQASFTLALRAGDVIYESAAPAEGTGIQHSFTDLVCVAFHDFLQASSMRVLQCSNKY